MKNKVFFVCYNLYLNLHVKKWFWEIICFLFIILVLTFRKIFSSTLLYRLWVFLFICTLLLVPRILALMALQVCLDVFVLCVGRPQDAVTMGHENTSRFYSHIAFLDGVFDDSFYCVDRLLSFGLICINGDASEWKDKNGKRI